MNPHNTKNTKAPETLKSSTILS